MKQTERAVEARVYPIFINAVTLTPTSRRLSEGDEVFALSARLPEPG